jgi:hypothetical protein
MGARSGSSRQPLTFAKEDEEAIITFPVHRGKVPRVYVKMVCKRLNLGAQ